MTRADGCIRVMTWNIHGGIGTDGRFDLARVVRVIQAHDPDIMALQEVDSRGRIRDAPFEYLAETLGIHMARAHTIVAPDGHYGHVLISRWALGDIKLHDVSQPRHERRCLIEVNVETPQGLLRVTAVHLGLRFGERTAQALQLARIAAAGPPDAVMMGDFNDWLWRGRVKRLLAPALPAHTVLRSFPAGLPLFMLDRIYCRPRTALLRAWTDRRSWWASDHLPVIADLRFA
jgi:endonuclease/exonuclease/phosphatase family metal-dependent hydrolase